MVTMINDNAELWEHELFAYFGSVQTRSDHDGNGGSVTRVRIEDNLSSNLVEFSLPNDAHQTGNNERQQQQKTNDNNNKLPSASTVSTPKTDVQLGATERHVLLLLVINQQQQLKIVEDVPAAADDDGEEISSSSTMVKTVPPASASSGATLWLYQLQTQLIYQLPIPAADGISNNSNTNWVPMFTEAKQIVVTSGRPAGWKNDVESTSDPWAQKRLQAQFTHWNNYKRQGWDQQQQQQMDQEDKLGNGEEHDSRTTTKGGGEALPAAQQQQQRRRWLLACTAFGVFLAANNNNTDQQQKQQQATEIPASSSNRPCPCSILYCIYRNESPLLSTACSSSLSSSTAEEEETASPSNIQQQKQQSINTMPTTTTNFGPKASSQRGQQDMPPPSAIELTFSVRKICAGQNHLALLSPLCHVYTLGTGTHGELGHGRVEKGFWDQAKLVDYLSEAGIRVVDIACGAWHTVALTDEGDLYGWGWNEEGQLGYPKRDFYIQPLPYPFELGDERAELVHCAGNSTFVLMSDGRQRVFGEFQSAADSKEIKEEDEEVHEEVEEEEAEEDDEKEDKQFEEEVDEDTEQNEKNHRTTTTETTITTLAPNIRIETTVSNNSRTIEITQKFTITMATTSSSNDADESSAAENPTVVADHEEGLAVASAETMMTEGLDTREAKTEGNTTITTSMSTEEVEEAISAAATTTTSINASASNSTSTIAATITSVQQECNSSSSPMTITAMPAMEQPPAAAAVEEQQQVYDADDEASVAANAKRPRLQRLLHLAVAGCSHGEMDTIYERLAEVERQRNRKFDLLICCGDFQALRNHGDLQHLHVPPQHRRLGTFYKYYSGEKVAPVLTLFIGGNHESSGYMAELPNGGWAAPNIYYMGYASVVQFAGLRIAGLSGIYKPNDYNRGHFERPPFHERGSLISAYHARSVDVFRLQQLAPRQPSAAADADNEPQPRLDICMSHDWPADIVDFGDRDWLLQRKPFFTEDVQQGRLGNPATMRLLHQLEPAHWFSAHLHVRFTAVVPHGEGEGEANSSGSRSPETRVTRFLALDKPMGQDRRRRFLEFMELPVEEDAPMELSYDPHWLAILRSTDALTEFTEKTVYMPGPGSERFDFRPTDEELASVRAAFGGDLRIPQRMFMRTAPPEAEPWRRGQRPASLYYCNPQSQQFCQRLGIRDLNHMFAQASAAHLGIPYGIQVEQAQQQARTIGSSNMNNNSSGNMNNGTTATAAATTTVDEGANGTARNPEEIDLGDEEDEFGGEDFVEDISGAGGL